MHHRPQIHPGLRRVWRDDSTLQIGLTPDAGVVVRGLGRFEARLVDQLDGTHRLSDLERWARTQGADPDRVRALVQLLSDAGVLVGAPADRAHLHRLGPERRQELAPDALAWSVAYRDAGDGFELLAGRLRRPVLLLGAGRLAEACRAAIACTAIPVEQPQTLRERSRVLAGLPIRDSGGVDNPPQPYPLVVVVDDDSVSAAVASALVSADLPHLVVLTGADRTTVGPLVVPGRSPCLHCLELSRTDRDPGWPIVAAQLDAPPPAERGETSLVQATADLVALQVACWVDGRRTPSTVGATLTLALPEGLPVRRTWRRHVRCGCSQLSLALLADA